MSNTNLANQIGQAWRYEREGKTEAAVAEFERVLKQDADNVDANYGMGLTQRRAGNRQAAIEYFEKAQKLVEATILARQQSRPQHHNEPNTPEDDRNMMLARMIKQRLTELKAAAQ